MVGDFCLSIIINQSSNKRREILYKINWVGGYLQLIVKVIGEMKLFFYFQFLNEAFRLDPKTCYEKAECRSKYIDPNPNISNEL